MISAFQARSKFQHANCAHIKSISDSAKIKTHKDVSSAGAKFCTEFSSVRIINTVQNAIKPVEVHRETFCRKTHRAAWLNSRKVTEK